MITEHGRLKIINESRIGGANGKGARYNFKHNFPKRIKYLVDLVLNQGIDPSKVSRKAWIILIRHELGLTSKRAQYELANLMKFLQLRWR